MTKIFGIPAGGLTVVLAIVLALALAAVAALAVRNRVFFRLGVRNLKRRPGPTVSTMRVKAIVRYDGGGTDGAGVLMPLRAAQQLLGKPRLVKAVFVSNAGGVAATDEVMPLLRAQAAPLGLEVDNTKQDALEQADAAGAAFMSFFTTFGSFSIAAGILLIFLIFVMLAAERRGELGVARAVGTRRGHLVQMFLYEGLAYDVVAAAVGALLGVT